MTTPQQPRVETPLVPKWRDKEVVCLLDTSGSMEWEAADGSPITRKDVVGEALPLFVKALENEDSQAGKEQASGSDELGGLLIHGFSNLHTELGDFNSSNFQRRWDAIQWGGGTTIVPAWKAALADFNSEFGDEVEPPVLLTLIVTDGEATDAEAFRQILETVNPDRYFAVAIVGHGDEHDKTLASYKSATEKNPKHLVVMAFDSVTNPKELADDLILMAGLPGDDAS
ncbi:MAG TPA: vWA domain-containing protein [Streptosporangiaceae bacterium]|nr:vWA domain-containing protein [Streptosporangiaceae bacterium]